VGVARYLGIKSLNKIDQDKIKNLVLNYMEKIDRYFVNYNFRMHIKVYKVGGKDKYSFHGKIDCPDFLFAADAVDWDLRRTVHKLMKKILNGLEHEFHKHQQKQQRFHPRKAKRGTDKRVKLKLRGRARLI